MLTFKDAIVTCNFNCGANNTHQMPYFAKNEKKIKMLSVASQWCALRVNFKGVLSLDIINPVYTN